MRPELTTLADRQYDLAIIGAGINGAAAAKAAAAAGYSVALLDKGDYGSGSSSRSSRLLHCGLRYLAPGGPATVFLRHPTRFLDAVKTVRRSMAVRSDLVRTQPDNLRPLRMHFPIYQESPYSGWQVDAAFALLHMLGDRRVPLDYKRTSGQKARDANPFLPFMRDVDALRSIASYTEYQFDWPERLVSDMVFEAETSGVDARNYTAVSSMKHEDGQWHLDVRDTLTGETAGLKARTLLNVAGVWVDNVNALSGSNAQRKVTGTKGAHLVFRLPDSCRGHGVAGMARNGRPFYCMPWRDLHFVGPTETLYEGDLNDVYADSNDVDFILSEARHMFPGFDLQRAEIVSTWAGIRPLTYDPALPMGHRSRRIYDLAPDGLPGAFALTNGSLGAHRVTGTDLVDKITGILGSRQPASPRARAAGHQEADGVADIASREHVVQLEDLMARRTGIMWDGDMGLEQAERMASEIAPVLGWDAPEIERQVAAYRDSVNHFYGVR